LLLLLREERDLVGYSEYFDIEHGEITLKLYVGKLPYRTTEQDLSDLFGQYGEVVSATVIIDRETGRSKGFGFVEMSNDQDAQNAMNQLNNSTLEGRTIVVNEAHDRREGGGGGSFQRRGGSGGGGGGGGGRPYGDRDGGYRDRRY
jgi:cold-inducible RNA-binding protein